MVNAGQKRRFISISPGKPIKNYVKKCDLWLPLRNLSQCQTVVVVELLKDVRSLSVARQHQRIHLLCDDSRVLEEEEQNPKKRFPWNPVDPLFCTFFIILVRFSGRNAYKSPLLTQDYHQNSKGISNLTSAIDAAGRKLFAAAGKWSKT